MEMPLELILIFFVVIAGRLRRPAITTKKIRTDS